VSAKEVFDRLEKTVPYLCSSKGGMTVSGGEPLLQPDFLIELFKLCKKASIHTCIDTSCFYKPKTTSKEIEKIIELTDLFLVDIKAIDPNLHKKITTRDVSEVLSFIDMLEKKKKSYWLRYVLVPGLNNKREHIKPLKEFLSKLKCCEKFEFLPYHTLGVHKWKLLGLKYPLKNTSVATSKDIENAQAEI
jgi:pyruvate formate lyase activating enzyme